MKEILDKESKKALVAYRIQRAYETLREAEVMIRESFYNAAINRLYYACYYATVALLLKYDIQTQTHNGVKTMPIIRMRGKPGKFLVFQDQFLFYVRCIFGRG